MAKDPAALFYIDTWLTATAEMKSDCRGWYLNLILHQYDKKDLPNDVEALASLAGVRHSEYEHFKQVFEQVLKQKFKVNESGRLENDYASEILRKREIFKDKRTKAGRIGYFIKFVKRRMKADERFLSFIKETVVLDDIDLQDEQVLEQVLEQVGKLYINGNGNGDIYYDSSSLETVADKKEEKPGLKKFNQKPLPEHFNGLPDVHIEKCIEYVFYTQKAEVTREQILAVWEMFKLRNLNGVKFYPNEGDVYSHFLNTLKTEKFTNANQRSSSSNRNNYNGIGSRSDDLTNAIINFGVANRGGNNNGHNSSGGHG